ncbi:MAG TPA: glycosyltransferase family protein [Nitrososphaerales archaeon]|nr:glycosyltransferase family protein [Nitrososphaerales archaeon]
MKVYLAAFGSGMGHASRMAALADELRAEGDEVTFSSSGEVTRWLKAKGYRCNDVPLVDVAFNDSGAFSATETLKELPVLMGRMCSQVQREVGNLGRFAPQVVLSDSMASTVVASKLMGVRSVAILNQLRLISSPRTPKTIGQILAGGSITLVNGLWELCDEILVPDLPPPYTISERNLWNAGSASSRARYIGFLTPKGDTGAPGDELLDLWRAEKRKRKVFWQVSGPPPTRGPFLAKALEAAKALEHDYLFVITAGNPGGETSPTRVPGGYLYQWCNISRAFIDSCDAVVSRAGHVSISDYILRAKPCLLVPIQSQTEQIGNANKAEKLGFAIVADEVELDPTRVGDLLRELSEERYGTRAQEMKRTADGYDALRAILSALRKA